MGIVKSYKSAKIVSLLSFFFLCKRYFSVSTGMELLCL